MNNRKPLHLVGETLLKQLQCQAILERQFDDDVPLIPDAFCLALSNQLPVEVH